MVLVFKVMLSLMFALILILRAQLVLVIVVHVGAFSTEVVDDADVDAFFDVHVDAHADTGDFFLVEAGVERKTMETSLKAIHEQTCE